MRYDLNVSEPHTNMDCLMHILSHLSLQDKLNCRLVSKDWRSATDKLFAGQKCLEIVLKNDRSVIKSGLNSVLLKTSMKFQAFHAMLTSFPQLNTIVTRDVQLNDVLILAITTTSVNLTNLNFYSCNRKDDSDEEPLNNLTTYGWQLLVRAYSHVTKLTLRNCSLTEFDASVIINGCPILKYLDIAENVISGECLSNLGSDIETLIVGSLNADTLIEPLLRHIIVGNGINLKRLEMRGGLNTPLTSLRRINRLEKLVLQFFCPQDQTIDTLSSISKLTLLKELILHQERCYDEHSAIDTDSFAAIIRGCCHLQKIVITGEYGWKLRLNDESLAMLPNHCPHLQYFSLSGNSPTITDKGLNKLAECKQLRSVSLTSFDQITDSGLISLISQHGGLDYIGIKETTSISNATLNACIELARSNPSRRLSISFAETKISKPKSLPQNLKVVFEETRPRRMSDEPSAMKMIAVVGMSAVILAMILITMLVVIVMPVGMLLMMLYDNCMDYAISSAEVPLQKNLWDVALYYGTRILSRLQS